MIRYPFLILCLSGCAPATSRDACRELVTIACVGCADPCYAAELVSCATVATPRELTEEEAALWPLCASELERGRACSDDPAPYPAACPRG